MEPWVYIIIALAVVIFIAAVILIVVKVNKASKIKQSNLEADKKVRDSASKVADCFGGKDNIESISQRGSRVTVNVKDTALIDKNSIDSQFDSVMYMGSKIVFIIGSMSEEFSALLKEKLEK